MASTIQIKRGTGSAVPSSLAAGELAINLDSGKLFYGNGSTVVSNFRVDNITADNYIVSSSVTSIVTQTLSGSTQFGDSADDTHQFTGNITVTGDISASGTITAESLNIKGNTILGDNNGGDLIAISGSIQLSGSNGIKIKSDLPGQDPSSPVGIYALTPGNLAFYGDGSTNIENINNITARSISSDLSSGQAISLGFDNSGGAGSFISLKAATGYDVIVESSLLISGSSPHITASGNISASGNIYANRIGNNLEIIDNLDTATIAVDSAGSVGNSGLTFNVDGVNRMNFGKDTLPINFLVNTLFDTPITASSHISSSGTIFTDTISSPTNNLIISSSTVRLTATTNGEANLILEADTDNDDENDNPFMDFLQDGGGVAGQIGISGDEDKWPDGNTLTGTSVNSMVIGMKGAASSTNRELIFATADTVALKLDNSQDAHFTSDITVPGNITANGNIIGDGATDISGIDTITTSGNISSSGGSIYGETVRINNKRALNESNNVGDLFDGLGSGARINLGKSNVAVSVFTHGSITASGDISSSGEIKANTLDIASTSNFADDITLGDTKKLKGVRIVISASANNNIYGTSTFHQNVNLNGTTTFNDVINGDTTLQGNLRLGGSGDTSNNWISIDAQNGNDSSGGGITFYETGTYDVDSPQYGAKIVYNEDDDEFAIGTMHNNTFNRQIYMKRGLDRVYLAERVLVEGASPLIIMDNTNTTVADGDTLGQIAFNNDDDDGSTLNIKGSATEDHASGTSGGSKFEFQVTPNGTSALVTAATIDQDKSLTVNNHITASGNISSSGEIISATSKIGLRNLGGRSDDLHNGAPGSTAQGDIFYHVGVSTDAGKIYTFQTNGNVQLADKDTGATATGSLFIAVGDSSADGMLLRGMVKMHTDVTANPGDPLYLGDSGLVTTTIPSSGDFARIIGHYQSGSGLIYFNPDNTFVEIS